MTDTVSPNPPLKLYGIKEAAAYCGLAVRTLKYHIYESGELKADANVGHSLVFTQATLDAFLRNRRPVGRPKASGTKPTGKPSATDDTGGTSGG